MGTNSKFIVSVLCRPCALCFYQKYLLSVQLLRDNSDDDFSRQVEVSATISGSPLCAGMWWIRIRHNADPDSGKKFNADQDTYPQS